MAIIGDFTDIAANQLMAAYRPVAFAPVDDGTGGTCPVVYCDVYFNGVYYKTLSSSSPYETVGIETVWTFDIQAVCQEYLSTTIPDITSFYVTGITSAIASCYCKFRNSTVDSYGIITPQATIPIQGTVDSAPVPGSGYQSITFYVVNASLQQADIQDLQTQLAAHKLLTYPTLTPPIEGTAWVFPLSYQNGGNDVPTGQNVPHPNACKVFAEDWGQFPIIIAKSGLFGSSSHSAKVTVFISHSGGMYVVDVIPSETLFDASIYLIPSGVQNLLILDSSFETLLANAYWYQIGIYDTTVDLPLFITPRFYVQLTSPAQPRTRIWFKNYLGQLEAINFAETESSLKVTSSNTETPLIVPPIDLNQTVAGMTRNNVRSNNNYTATGQFLQSDMYLLKQLFDSSQTFIEVPSNNPTDTASAVLSPIKLVDTEIPTLTWLNSYEYRITAKYIMSNENIIVRQ